MLIDAKELPAEKTLLADVVIVGAGAAGIVLAHELTSRNQSVLLLESGGFRFDEPTQKLYDGPAVGTVLTPEAHYLASTRLRYYGGSTNHWSGWCRPLDPIDFEQRDRVPHSGWPIGADELARYYRRAEKLLEIPSFDTEADQLGRDRLLIPESDRIATKLFHIRKRRFRNTIGHRLLSSDAQVVTHANLVEIRLHTDGRGVKHLDICSSSGTRFRAVGKSYVLATGGVENARLLLASRSVQEAGVGNGNDLVGRCFMEHPHGVVGSIVITRPAEAGSFYLHQSSPKDRKVPTLCLADAESRRERRASVSLTLEPSSRASREPEEAFWRSSADIDRLRSPGWDTHQPFFADLYARWEQTPNYESRVTLSNASDRLGVPRSRLEWKLTDQDLTPVREIMKILAQELGRFRGGRLASTMDPEDPWKGIVWGAHHMGTTRMAASPGQGVVDSNCKVFGVGNLWVAGSSVFPTVGFANPTLTILALTYRLAELLEGGADR
jgi:choline dehydrogenase-like flavoprotein